MVNSMDDRNRRFRASIVELLKHYPRKTDLAAALGMQSSNITGYLNCSQTPSLVALEAFAKAQGIPMSAYVAYVYDESGAVMPQAIEEQIAALPVDRKIAIMQLILKSLPGAID